MKNVGKKVVAVVHENLEMLLHQGENIYYNSGQCSQVWLGKCLNAIFNLTFDYQLPTPR